jgi:alkaline phosphatase
MTQASLNHLDDDPDGFYLHVEGGACDWAMHGNSMARMIEEHTDFNNSVQAVIDYLDAGTNGNDWSNTLLIVTSDHDHNLYGENSDTVAFEDVNDKGAGNNPGHIWHDSNHGNQLVPMWVRGAHADLFDQMPIEGTDLVFNEYLHQDSIGQVMAASVVPEPSAALLLLGAAGIAGCWSQRRR